MKIYLFVFVNVVFFLSSALAASGVLSLTPTNCVVVKRSFSNKLVQYGDLIQTDLKNYSFICKFADRKKLTCKDTSSDQLPVNFVLQEARSSEDKQFYSHVVGDYHFGDLQLNKKLKSFSYDSAVIGDSSNGLTSNTVCVGSIIEI